MILSPPMTMIENGLDWPQFGKWLIWAHSMFYCNCDFCLLMIITDKHLKWAFFKQQFIIFYHLMNVYLSQININILPHLFLKSLWMKAWIALKPSFEWVSSKMTIVDKARIIFRFIFFCFCASEIIQIGIKGINLDAFEASRDVYFEKIMPPVITICPGPGKFLVTK